MLQVTEHILYHHISKHFENNHILINQQFGFHPSHSCEAQLISVVVDIQRTLDQGSQVDVIFIDFKRAFDSIPHQRLLYKLHHYRIQGKALQWINVWLTQV